MSVMKILALGLILTTSSVISSWCLIYVGLIDLLPAIGFVWITLGGVMGAWMTRDKYPPNFTKKFCIFMLPYNVVIIALRLAFLGSVKTWFTSVIVVSIVVIGAGLPFFKPNIKIKTYCVIMITVVTTFIAMGLAGLALIH